MAKSSQGSFGFKCASLICGKLFWNGFCSPRYPGIHILLLLVVLNFAYACVYVLMAIKFDNFTTKQHTGYCTLLLANIILIVSGLLSMHFLSQKPDRMKVSYCIFIHVALIVATILGFLSIYFMLLPADLTDIQSYNKRNLLIYNHVLYFMQRIFVEKKCCGIKEFGDIFPLFYKEPPPSPSVKSSDQVKQSFYKLAPSCCRQDSESIYNECVKLVTKQHLTIELRDEYSEKYLYTQPCLQVHEDYSTFQATEAYQTYLATVHGMYGVFFFIIGIVGILNYYIWYKFPRAPKHLCPTRFNKDLRLMLSCQYEQLRDSVKARDEAEKEKHAEPHKARLSTPSDFRLRHELIKQSLAEMKEFHKNMRRIEEMDEEMEKAQGGLRSGAGSKTNVREIDSAFSQP